MWGEAWRWVAEMAWCDAGCALMAVAELAVCAAGCDSVLRDEHVWCWGALAASTGAPSAAVRFQKCSSQAGSPSPAHSLQTPCLDTCLTCSWIGTMHRRASTSAALPTMEKGRPTPSPWRACTQASGTALCHWAASA